MPLYQIGKFLRTPGRLRKVKKARAAGFAVAAVAIVTGILLIPTPLRIQGTLVLTAARPDEIYAEIEGQLVELNVRDGEWVRKDAVIAKLINHEKQRELVQKQADHDINWAKAQWYNQSPELNNRAMARQHLQAAEELEPIIQKVNEQIDKLTLVATRDGQVMGVPHPETIGQVLKPGKPFCDLGDPHHIEAHLIVDQADIDLIRLGSRAWLKIYGRAETTYLSAVSEIAKRSRDEIPPELSHVAGGEIAGKADPKTGAVKPQTAVYEAIIPIENPNLTLQPGLRGFAKIDGGTHTFGWWLYRLFHKTFHFSL
jgi:putative peptide zinc metalloprotease protein